jgi:hypothetical protein
MRAYRRSSRLARPIVALMVALAAASAASAQVVVFDSNGFESPTFNPGSINNQQGFAFLPNPAVGVIQSGTTLNGGQAFQLVGTQILPNAAYGDANFLYRGNTFAAATNLVASGNPIVRVSYDGRVSGALAIPSDIPFGGPYLESYTPGQAQQALTPILFNINGGISVFSNFTVGGGDGVIATADGLVPRETWVHVEAQLDFSSQSFRVLLNGNPLTFTEGTFSGIDVPFRNSSGLSQRIAEIGFQGYYNANFNPTFNNMYFDNVSITATPVPEPSSMALAGLGLTGLVIRLRRKMKNRSQI